MIKRKPFEKKTSIIARQSVNHIKVGNTNITLTSSVRNMRFIITLGMTVDNQLTAVCLV